jgi:hypothetical protein
LKEFSAPSRCPDGPHPRYPFAARLPQLKARSSKKQSEWATGSTSGSGR